VTTERTRSSVPTGRWTSEYETTFLTDVEELDTLSFLATLPYLQYRTRGVVLKRKMCEFGVSYPPTGSIGPAEPIPSELGWLKERLAVRCGVDFDQLIVTWYPPGAGIGPHRDHLKWFDETIAGVSLGGAGILRGSHPAHGKRDQVVVGRSLYVLRDASRHVWKHELRPTRADRWSLTFRRLTESARSRLHDGHA
jgi:alkylated DNA repair protein (DNA oxidative demethylase)